jgi:hypothetical protein
MVQSGRKTNNVISFNIICLSPRTHLPFSVSTYLGKQGELGQGVAAGDLAW